MRTASVEQAQSGVARMLREGILTDITVNAAGGSMRAHRAVLAARSPVFLSMFSHNLREKELSTVDISDMSIDACKALVRYLYGDARSEWELLEHRSELVAAGDKYGIANLKKACEESLREDVGVENVLDRLQMAHTYSLPALKRTCVRLLVDFGKMYEIPEDFEAFMAAADQDLADEI
uniref:BTB domain-containing protein n=2 Tax=Triticum urartu TaxID=4572 RepID=A0A8R7UH11_TRIUA